MRRLSKILYHNLHWILSAFLIVYTIIPFLSPIFFHLGYDRPGWWIQTIYRFFCHQRPERSLFLFGQHLTYSTSDLAKHGYENGLLGYPFVGDSTLGYKAAMCVRDVSLYGSMGIAGVIASASKKQLKIPWPIVLLAIIPIALDGGVQFVSEFLYLTQDKWGLDLAHPYYLSNNSVRAITGVIFGSAVGLLIFSELKAALANTNNTFKKT